MRWMTVNHVPCFGHGTYSLTILIRSYETPSNWSQTWLNPPIKHGWYWGCWRLVGRISNYDLWIFISYLLYLIHSKLCQSYIYIMIHLTCYGDTIGIYWGKYGDKMLMYSFIKCNRMWFLGVFENCVTHGKIHDATPLDSAGLKYPLVN